MKCGTDNLLIIEIISTIFYKEINSFTPQNQQPFLKKRGLSSLERFVYIYMFALIFEERDFAAIQIFRHFVGIR